MRDGMEVLDKAAMSAETDRTIMSTYSCAHELAGSISQPFQTHTRARTLRDRRQIDNIVRKTLEYCGQDGHRQSVVAS